jgi:hypothetical protein
MDRRDFLTGGAAGGLVGLHSAAKATLSDRKIPTVERLSAVDPSQSAVVYVEGREEPGDGGEGLFVWSETQNPDAYDRKSTRAEGALYVRSDQSEEGNWFRVIEQPRMNVRWFGARGDGTGDDAAAINDALWVSGASGVLHTYIPGGTYRLDRPVRIGDWGSGHLIEGDGILTTRLVKKSDGTARMRGSGPDEVDACIAIDRFDTGQRVVDFYGTEIRGMSLQGNSDDEKNGPFSRTYGIYVRGANRLQFSNMQFRYFNTAFFARTLWMSSLDHLKASQVRNFVVVGGTESMIREDQDEDDEDAYLQVPSSTSVNISNCFCTNDISGTAFLLNKLYYSTISNCGADYVDGWPYHVKRARGITLESTGFEWSQAGRGVWFEGSTGTVIGLQGLNTRPNPDETVQTSLLHVTEDSTGQASGVTVHNSYVGDFTDKQNRRIPPSDLNQTANSNIRLTGGSDLTLIQTRVSRNGGDDPGWKEGEGSQLVALGGNLAPSSLRIQDAGGLIGENGRATILDSNGINVHDQAVVGERQEAVKRLDQTVDSSYDASQIQAISDKVDAIIDVLSASSGHGLTDD